MTTGIRMTSLWFGLTTAFDAEDSRMLTSGLDRSLQL